MKKRLFQRALIITMLLMLSGCASIQARASSCQQMLANRNELPRKERQVLVTLDQMAPGGLAPAAAGTWPCKYAPSPCRWPGVTCTSGYVTAIDFTFGNLSGEIPPELGSLSQLEYLILAMNQLSGPIPPELANLSNLQVLYLTGNDLSGEIPPELGSLSQLTTLDLTDNQLSGPIPPELGSLSQLVDLFLAGNQLSGEIPPELGSLTQLKRLHLAYNQLSGSLPRDIANLPLDTLNISNTGLCIPKTAEFEAWISTVPHRDFDEVPYCE